MGSMPSPVDAFELKLELKTPLGLAAPVEGGGGQAPSEYSWPFGPMPMGARCPAQFSPARARPGPGDYWAPGGMGPIAVPCLGLNAGPLDASWHGPKTPARLARRAARWPGTAHGPLPRLGQAKSRWRPAAGPAQRSGYIRGAGRCPRPPPGLHSPPRPRPLSAPLA